MPPLDIHARQGVESEFDAALRIVSTVESSQRDLLREVGVEPSIETILASFVGAMEASVRGIYRLKFNRKMNSDESQELTILLKRRITDLREAFMAERMQK